MVDCDDITDFASLLSGTQMPAQKYVYDAENRLTAVTTTDDTPLLELRYDAIGRRVLTIDHVGLGDPCGTSGGSAILPGTHADAKAVGMAAGTWPAACSPAATCNSADPAPVYSIDDSDCSG